MLVLDYDMKWPDSAVVPGNVTIKLTMADKTDDCLPQKIRRQYDACDGITTIRCGVCTGSMLTTAANSDLTIESVTLDGHGFENNAWTTPAQVDGGLIGASGNVTLGEKTLLCNSYTTKSNKDGNGGAIAYSGPGTLTMSDGSVIDHCKAQNNGAVVYVNASGATETNPVNIVMQDGALWQNCEVTNGLVYVTMGVVNLSGTFDNKSSADDTAYNVSGCTVGSGGGLAYVTGGTLNANGQIREFAANNGGALYVNNTGVVTVNAGIGDCTVQSNGGAIYVNNSGAVTVNARIGTCTANASGGGLFVNKGTATLSGAIEHCEANNGGAIYVSGNGTANVNEGVSDCAAQANGGVFVNSGTANLDGMLENCAANNGGAVYANGSGGVANVNTGIDCCTARASGGGVYANQGTANLNGTIENCSAHDGGGAYVNFGGTISLYAGIDECVTTRNGGGVYVNRGSLNMAQAQPLIRLRASKVAPRLSVASSSRRERKRR